MEVEEFTHLEKTVVAVHQRRLVIGVNDLYSCQFFLILMQLVKVDQQVPLVPVCCQISNALQGGEAKRGISPVRLEKTQSVEVAQDCRVHALKLPDVHLRKES